jgi:hypothetical protein
MWCLAQRALHGTPKTMDGESGLFVCHCFPVHIAMIYEMHSGAATS